VVAPAPRVHIVPPWWWYGQPIKLSFDNLPILEFGETHTPGPGQKFEPVITWEPDDTINTADYFNQVNELYVKVKAENAGGVARDSVKLVFQTECIKVNFDPEELSPGDTARLSFQRVKEDGTLEDLPAGSYTFSVMIVGGEDSSRGLFVTEEEEPEGGTTLLYASAPILYIAPSSIPDTSMKVRVIGAAWEVIWGKKDEVKGQAPGRQQLSVKQAGEQGGTEAEGKTKGDLAKPVTAARLAALLASWCPINEVVVKRKQTPQKLVVTLSKRRIGHSESVSISAKVYDEKNQEMRPENATFDIVVGDEGISNGSLVNSETGARGPVLLRVPVSHVKDGKISYVADGEEVASIFPLGIRVLVSSEIDGKFLFDMKAFYLTSSANTAVHYTQNDITWAGEDYDTYRQLDDEGNIIQPEHQFTIGEKGRALTCLAMILRAAGFDYDPSTLSEIMVEENLWAVNKNGNYTGGVDWGAVNALGKSAFTSRPIRRGDPNNLTNRTPMNLAEINEYLTVPGFYVMVEVANPGNHWVLVTGMSNGEYTILDPGGYPERVTLDSYNNQMYRAVIYERKK